jgi:hypothetical protein
MLTKVLRLITYVFNSMPTNSVKQTFSWATQSHSATKKFRAVIETQGTLPSSQEPAVGSYPDEDEWKCTSEVNFCLKFLSYLRIRYVSQEIFFFHLFQLNCRSITHFASSYAHSVLCTSQYPGAAHANNCRQKVKILKYKWIKETCKIENERISKKKVSFQMKYIIQLEFFTFSSREF